MGLRGSQSRELELEFLGVEEWRSTKAQGGTLLLLCRVTGP